MDRVLDVVLGATLAGSHVRADGHVRRQRDAVVA